MVLYPDSYIGCIALARFLFGALKSAFFKKRYTLFSAVVLLSFFAFFSASKGKLLTYMLPCFVPLSILIAHYIEELKDRPDEKISKVNASINIAFGLMGISAVIYSFIQCQICAL